MRNLKRALSLALASVMLMGMMVVGTSAASFPDVDGEDNIEAIDVLETVQVMIGDEGTGEFRPDDPVNRAEMAVVMAKLLNLDYNYYVTTCPFTDVSGNYEWAKGWVGACAANGIVSGRGEGIFDPGATVTAVEAASMMMRALGYFQHPGDYNGGFEAATVKQASQIGLFTGIDGNARDPMNRNQVAKLALNALESNMVYFSGDVGFDFNGVNVGYRSEYTYRTGTESKYAAISGLGDATVLNGTQLAQGQHYVNLGEQLYDGKLRLNDNAADDYDRPSRQWEYDSKEIGIYPKYDLLREEYTVGVTGKDLYELLTASTIKDYDVFYYVDGKADETIKASNMIRTNDRTYDTTGKGVLTQVYVDHTKKEINIVSINTFLAKVTADYNDKKGTLSVEVYAPVQNPTAKTIEVEEVPGIEDYKKDDYILVNWAEIGSASGTYGKYEVVAVSDPQITEDAELSKYSEEDYVVSDGEQFDYAKMGIYKNELDVYTTGSLKDHTYNLFFDHYGYLAGVTEYSGEKNYLFLAAYDGTGSHMGIKTSPGAAVFLDGTMEEIQINVTDTNKNLSKAGKAATGDEIDNTNYPYLSDGANQYNRWFTYTTTTKSNGTVYTLKPVVTWDGTKVTNNWIEQTAKGTDPDPKDPVKNPGSDTEVKINSGSVRVVADVASGTPVVNKRAYGNDDSVYLTMEINDVSKDENGASGAEIGLTKVTGVYTGVQDVDLRVYGAKTNTLKDNSGIIAVFDDDLYIIGAVVVGEDDSSADKYIYILDGAKNERYDREADCSFWEMDAVVDGVITTVTVKDEYGTMKTQVNNITGVAHPGKDCLVEVTYDKDGYITDIDKVQPTDVNNDDRYSAADYTNDIEKGYNGGANDFKTYSVEYDDHSASDDKPQTGDFYRVGRTLYSRTLTKQNQKDDAGITLGPDGKVIVVQNDRTIVGQKAKRVWDEFSDLQSAINWLADAKTFEGFVSAVLNDNGSAQYIVFNGIAELGTVDDNGNGDGANVFEYPLGTLNVTSTDRLSALDVADAIRDYLDDNRIVDVYYDARNGEATVSYTGNRSVHYKVIVDDNVTSAELDGARKIGEVIKDVAPGGKAQSGSTVKVEGNTVTTLPTNGTDYMDNSGGHAPATIDLAYFLKGLHDDGAKTIEYDNKTYVWNPDKNLKTSNWCEKQADGTVTTTTLVSAITAKMTTDAGSPKPGDRVYVTAPITVDGAKIVIALDFTVPSKP